MLSPYKYVYFKISENKIAKCNRRPTRKCGIAKLNLHNMRVNESSIRYECFYEDCRIAVD